ncbi:MAG: peptidylprolyl isomerase [Alphaproteobacteria bacterium]
MIRRLWPRGTTLAVVFVAWTLGLVLAADARAQLIVAIVNDDAITDRDVRQRLNLALFATGQRPGEEAAARLRPQVLRSLIDERLQLQEAERLGVTVAEEDIDAAIDRIAANNDTSREQLFASLERGGVDLAAFERQIHAQLAWRQVAQRQLLPRVVVSDVQIAQRLEEINAGRPEFRLAEIFLPIYEDGDEQRVLRDAARLREAIAGGADFAALARQFSAAPSAERGGELGWIPTASVPEQLQELIRELPDGGVSRPVRTRDGVYLFRRLGAREERASRLAISLMQLDIAGERVDGASIEDFATEARAASSSCDELGEVAGEVDGLTIQRLDDVPPDRLEGRLATVALTQPVGVLSEPLRTADGGTALVMVCGRDGGAGPEQRAEVEERLRGEALEQLATRYLRNLRRDAFIELRLEQG